MSNTYFKIDKIFLTGEIKGEASYEEGDSISLEYDYSIGHGIIAKKDGNKIVMLETTAKKSPLDNRDITPTIECHFDNPEALISSKPQDLSYEILPPARRPTDNEIRLLNDFHDDENEIHKENVSVIDVTEDFKILILTEAILTKWSDGTKIVEFNTYKYSLKYGIIYEYDSNQESDTIDDIDISDIL